MPIESLSRVIRVSHSMLLLLDGLLSLEDSTTARGGLHGEDQKLADFNLKTHCVVSEIADAEFSCSSFISCWLSCIWLIGWVIGFSSGLLSSALDASHSCFFFLKHVYLFSDLNSYRSEPSDYFYHVIKAAVAPPRSGTSTVVHLYPRDWSSCFIQHKGQSYSRCIVRMLILRDSYNVH